MLIALRGDWEDETVFLQDINIFYFGTLLPLQGSVDVMDGHKLKRARGSDFKLCS